MIALPASYASWLFQTRSGLSGQLGQPSETAGSKKRIPIAGPTVVVR